MTARTAIVALASAEMAARREAIRVNVELAGEIADLRASRLALVEEVARLRALFLTCVPPSSAEWSAGLPEHLHSPDWRIGWDSCREKLIALLDINK